METSAALNCAFPNPLRCGLPMSTEWVRAENCHNRYSRRSHRNYVSSDLRRRGSQLPTLPNGDPLLVQYIWPSESILLRIAGKLASRRFDR